MVGIKKEGKMNYNLEQEIEEIVDRQLQDLGFIDLCTRIAQKVVERVQKIDEEHSIIKTELTDIEEKLNLIFADKKPTDSKVQVVKRNVIVIDEEDEKPLLEKLQELSRSSQNLSCSGDIASPKAQSDFQRDQARSKNEIGHGEIVSRDSTNVVKNEKTPIGTKRTSTINGSDIQNSSFESVGPKRFALLNNLSEPQVTSSSSETFQRTTAGTESKVNSSISFINRNLYRSPPKDTAGKIASLSFTSLKTSNKNESDQAKSTIKESASSVAKNSKSTSERLEEGSNSPCSVDKSVVVKSSASVEETDEQEQGLKQETADEYDFADESYEFKEGDSVLGKPEKSDIWYTAKITRIIATKYGQKKYQVKFDSGQRMYGTLPGNSLAPIAHPKGSSLNVGSRVVAIRPRDTVDARIQKKYMTLNSLVMAKGEILYGGVVVERACEDNRKRFLVFFDDGFAQYMTEKKMHLVIHSAENVWQDVSIHCREFIKEYLEEFPERPMLKLKAGLCVQTEWNGKWLQAKVVAVDCSLVKMLFDVDKRTEWIYRGSTRLEPLYSELERRDLEALKNKGKKSSKKRKSVASNTKKVEPFVEDAITKPCFGISRFSKTDPQGIQQIKEWGPVEEKSSSASVEQDEKSLYVSADNEGGSPTSGGKVGSDSGKNYQTLSKKRKMDNLSEHGSVSSVDANSPENAAGSNRNPGSNATINLPSPKNPRQCTAKTFQRHSSQSSIESSVSDSQLLLRNSNQGRFERQLSSQSLQSESLNSKSRGTGFVRHRSSGALGSETRGNFGGNGAPSVPVTRSKSMAQLFSSPERSVDTQLIAKRRSSSQEKLLQPFASATRQRMILPRPPQQQMQYLKLAQSSAGQPTKVLVPIVGHIGAAQGPTTSTHMVALINLTQSFPKIRGPHQCSTKCIPEVYLPQSERKRHNPLSVPLLLGWTRETAKRRPGYHRDIYYRSPCSKRLRNLSEVTKYLLQTKATNVTIDEFSFDASISCRDQIPIFKTPRLKIDDISNGMEKIPISCVNERNDELPPNVEYISERIIGLGIDMNHDSGFLASCDCKDNCQDRTKCACARLTIDSSDAINGKKDEHCGYQYRRLREGVTTGIYECGRNCSCSATCYNKVVQNGIGVRLQVFMTEDKGWGLRCLDDIPRGAFICTYSGQILNEEMADKEGKDFGDEYLAELDHIEIVEQAKEGYESDVPELRQEKKTERSLSFESSNKEYDSDSDESEFGYISTSESSDSLDSNKSITKETNTPPLQQPSNRPTTNTPSKVASGDVIDLTLESDPENEAENSKRLLGSLKEEGVSTPSSLDQMIHRLKTGVDCNGKMIDRLVALRQTVTQKLQSQESKESPSKADSTENLEKDEKSEGESPKIKLKFEIGGESPDNDLKPEAETGSETGERLEEAKPTVKIDWNDEVKKAIETIGPKIRKAVARKSTRSILFQKLSKDERNKPEPRVLENVAKNDVSQAFVSGKTFTSPRSSTGGHFARKSTSHRIQITPPGQRPQQTQNEPQQEQDAAKDDKEAESKSTRLLFGEDQCYVIDAKSFGNVGRYLNHSCMPNLFVQNVFYDTHDLRFPLVAFFTQQNVPALTELTWDYSYEVGSVPGKVLQCYCGSIECRGRLL